MISTATKTTGKVSYEKYGAITTIAIEQGSFCTELRYLNCNAETIDKAVTARGFTRTTEWNLTTDGEAIYGEAQIDWVA